MAVEKWLAITSTALFAMFAGEMISVYNFIIDVPETFEFGRALDVDAKIFQFISIGAAPAGILATVPFFMTKHYGSKPIGGMIIAGGIIMLLGMYVCYSMIGSLDDVYLTDTVKITPILFMILSAPVIVVGTYLFKHEKKRPKKEYF